MEDLDQPPAKVVIFGDSQVFWDVKLCQQANNNISEKYSASRLLVIICQSTGHNIP
jgi:hypothetical protein